QPRAVAVVGASARDGSLGGALLAHLFDGGFTGPVYAVHPSATPIRGQTAYATVRAIGQPVDLALIAVPAAAVEAAVADCAAAGVRGVVVVSAGFAEAGAAGRERQQRLVETVRAAGMRLVGPNCFGVLNSDAAFSLNATIAPLRVAPGPVAMLSQSGALGFSVLARCARLGIGLSSFVSVGNKADVSGNDLLAYWNEDARTRVVLLYLESFGNPRKFARVAPEVSRRVPIVVVKAARSVAGTRVAGEHSAALANLDIAVDALLAQAGVIRTDTIAELLEVASLLASQPIPPGTRVGVVTNAGGPAVLFADAAEAAGLTLPSAIAGDNPLDLFAAQPDDYAAAMSAIGARPAIDAVVAIYATPLPAEAAAFAAAIARGAAAAPAAKPVLAVFMTTEEHAERLSALHAGARGRLPVYEFPESAARALGAAARYAQWRARPAGAALELDAFARQAVRAVVDRVLSGSAAAVVLAAADVTAILGAAGITVAMAERVAPRDVAAAAERLGYPLAMKAVASGLVHRREAGAVLLGLADAAAVEDAVAVLCRRIPALTALELQRQIADGVEVLVGVTTDPTFGPLLACRIDAPAGAAPRRAAVPLPPVSEIDAAAMLDGLPPGLDRQALIDVIRRVSALVDVLPELQELVLEPIKVLPEGSGAVVVGASLRLARD
ncbi:MAG: acetate--CoA ligase family protein, partial [bacterium]